MINIIIFLILFVNLYAGLGYNFTANGRAYWEFARRHNYNQNQSMNNDDFCLSNNNLQATYFKTLISMIKEIDIQLYKLFNSDKETNDRLNFEADEKIKNEIEKEWKIYEISSMKEFEKLKDKRSFLVLKYLNGFKNYKGYKQLSSNEISKCESAISSTFKIPNENEIEDSLLKFNDRKILFCPTIENDKPIEGRKIE